MNLSGPGRTPIAREGVEYLVEVLPDTHAGLIAETEWAQAFEELPQKKRHALALRSVAVALMRTGITAIELKGEHFRWIG